MIAAAIVKTVWAYDSTEWEIFIREWQAGLKVQNGYNEVKRLGGPGDLGRDVVGLCTPAACDGTWDNFQCKHYSSPLSVPKACEDAGKIVFHASRGAFTPPRKYTFVAPRGPSIALRDMLLRPSKFKAEILSTWNTRVADKVVEGEDHILEGNLATFAEAYDYSTFTYATIDEVLDGYRQTAFWASRFGGLLPTAPAGVVPTDLADEETVYVGKLLAVYGETHSQAFRSHQDLSSYPELEKDLQKQRERFYDAEAFVAHYRDQTEPGTVEDFSQQILEAIEPAMAGHTAAAQRLNSALSMAGVLVPASVLAPRARPRVKQGVCHQLANDGPLKWTL